MTDQEAITRLKRGDIRGLADLVERYQTQAVRAAYLVTHDRALAEDVAQGAFLNAYRSIASFDAQRPFAPWFLRSVVNAAVLAARRAARQQSLDAPTADLDDVSTFADLLPDPAPSLDETLEASELRQQVWAALAALAPEQRAAVVMRYYLGLSERDMADALALPAGTIKWRLHAARKRLRALLGGIAPQEG